WFALLAHGSLVTVSRLHSVPLVAAAGCGASIAAAAVDAVAVDRPALVGVGLAATSVAVAAGRTATDGGGLVLALAIAATAMAAALAARFGRPLLDRPTAALALFALAAMVGPGSTRGAGLLLAAGGTLSCALGWPAAAVLGLPGGVALAIALSGRGGGVALV